jgi:hypothetical protein
MKGTLQKNEYNVWVVRYRETTPLSITTETLPLHPDFIEMMDTCFTSKFKHEIEFEIITEWENGEVGVNGLTYAKLIKEEKPFIDNREEKLETLAKLLAKSWFYGNWEWENPNERVMQMLMQDLGLYPFKNEDEMIQQTRVDEDLYKEAVDKVELRNPRLMPIENHPVDTNEMICMFEPRTDTSSSTICKNCGKEKFLHNQVSDIRKMVEYDVEKVTESDYVKFLEQKISTLYPEEQVREAYYQGAADVHDKCTHRTWRGVETKVDIEVLKKLNAEYIQSLKQSKQ